MNQQLISAAHRAWCSMAEIREHRQRYKRYTYGDQWGDTVRDSSGRLVSEGDVISTPGRPPLTNNLIRRLVKTIIGRYRSLLSQSARYTGPLAEANALNDFAELDSRLLEEFLISGCAIQHVCRDTRPAGAGVWVDNVNPEHFFAGPFNDPRGNDVDFLGQIHEMSVSQVLARFGADDPRRQARLASVMADSAATGSTPVFGADADGGFFGLTSGGRCRIIELWTLDARRRNGHIRFQWRCRWLTPTGELLATHTAPTHPFVFKFYPYTDGEVHPFVEDVIDQQRYINRIIVLIDRMMGSAAKGVLLFPVDQKTDEFSWREITERWSTSDGVIPIKGRSTILPQQVVGNGADAGAHRLLELELKLFEDASGVSEALLGRTSGNEGTAMYRDRVSNATIALADILDTFGALTRRRNEKILSSINRD